MASKASRAPLDAAHGDDPIGEAGGGNAEVHRSFATIRDMLLDRGVDATSLNNVSAHEVLAIGASRNVFHVDLPSCGYRVIYDLNPKFRLVDVRKLLEEDGPTVYLLVVRDRAGPTHAAIKGVEELGKDVQFFGLHELQYNVSRHMLVPRHEPMRDEADIAAVTARYHLKSRFQLPLILSTDPMARYLALKPGQLVRITRESLSAGTYVLYRCCTAKNI